MDELSHYDYELPPALIAAEPLAKRDASRMLVVDRRRGTLAHHVVSDLPNCLRPGDRLVLNDTRVIPARLFGRRQATGGKWEGLFLRSLPSGHWQVIGHSGGRLQPGEVIEIVPAHQPTDLTLTLTLCECDGEGVWVALPSQASADGSLSAIDLLARYGTVPLPPYIGRKLARDSDWDRYQTAYALKPGAVAAPTAGLHFTPQLFEECQRRGISRSFVTLHVGIGTFRPIACEHLSDHKMHQEWCELSEETCREILQTRSAGGRIVAIGTTTVRTLETASRAGHLAPWRGETDLFLRPPHEFRGLDCLLTNFHLPRSTLLVLVSAFAGLELTRAAYREAVRERYRFFSYGDCMLIV